MLLRMRNCPSGKRARPAFRCFVQATLDAIDHPFEPILLRVAWQDVFDAAVLHQFIKIGDGAPPAGVDTHRGDAQLITNLDALFRVLNIGCQLGGVGCKKRLVCGEANQIDTVAKGLPLEFLQITPVLGRERFLLRQVHLLMQDVQPFSAEFGRLIDDGFD